mmetsp:Transcript_7081/g.43701  ORF Transcript_7081/g.43701 Transcript_7081/m.43701 type:complete len:167 (+) Transcript_7081:50-550(+)
MAPERERDVARGRSNGRTASAVLSHQQRPAVSERRSDEEEAGVHVQDVRVPGGRRIRMRVSKRVLAHRSRKDRGAAGASHACAEPCERNERRASRRKEPLKVLTKTTWDVGRRQDDRADPTRPRTTNVQCSKCESREAVYVTESTTEGMTLYFQCTRCGNKWRDYV